MNKKLKIRLQMSLLLRRKETERRKTKITIRTIMKTMMSKNKTINKNKNKLKNNL